MESYKKIEKNVGLKAESEDKPMVCGCKKPLGTNEIGCRDTCINYKTQIECSAELCPLQELCTNQKIQKKEWNQNLLVIESGEKGFGVVTNAKIKCDEFILEYVGEVIKKDMFEKRMNFLYKNDIHHYCMSIGHGFVIDAHRKGNIGRFINHSCNPNCEIQKWSVNGLNRMALFALRDIQIGEELNYNYNFECFNSLENQVCFCKSENCKGFIGKMPTKTVRSMKKPRKSYSLVPSKERININRCFFIHNSMYRSVLKSKLTKEDTEIGKQTFLLRNLLKIYRMKRKKLPFRMELFKKLLNTYSVQRLVKTRSLMLLEENSEEAKIARLAKILEMICDYTITEKDKLDNEILSFTATKFSRIKKIDLSDFKTNIVNAVYRSVEQFDYSMKNTIKNHIKYYGRFSENGIAVTQFEKAYNNVKLRHASEIEILNEQPLPFNFVSGKKHLITENTVKNIRCICKKSKFVAKKFLIQCRQCLIWQHCSCVKVNSNSEKFFCEKCYPRKVYFHDENEEIISNDKQEYFSLMKENLHISIGDGVYLLRENFNQEINNNSSVSDFNHYYFEINCEIYRIEKLWKNERGEKFLRCRRYVRPYEIQYTYDFKFYPNEILETDFYRIVPLNLIVNKCYILNFYTYRTKRLLDAHDPYCVYICNYRWDRRNNLRKFKESKFIKRVNNLYGTYESPLKLTKIRVPYIAKLDLHDTDCLKVLQAYKQISSEILTNNSNRNEIIRFSSLNEYLKLEVINETQVIYNLKSKLQETMSLESIIQNLKKNLKYDNFPENCKRVRKKRTLFDYDKNINLKWLEKSKRKKNDTGKVESKR